MNQLATIITSKNSPKFICEPCDFKCCKKGDYNRHIMTAKHKMSMDTTDLAIKITSKTTNLEEYTCDNCEKIYKDKSGLWRHKKKCVTIKEKSMEIEEDLYDKNNELTQTQIQNPNELILFLVKENQEFKKMMIEMQKQLLQEQNKQSIELNKQILEIAKDAKTTTINNNCNNTNNKFNMNIFLNEKCKDALNIMDFVTSLPLNLIDLEETGKQGYVKGLSRILINGLKDIDVSKRPIHCSDLKRETLYVKDNNVWEKEDTEKKRIKNAIKYISLKNAKQITKWTKENEGYRDSSNKKSDVYLKLVYEANGGDEDELNKIIKNISANVTIDK